MILAPIKVDDREPAPDKTVAELRDLGAQAEVERLDAGDFAWIVTDEAQTRSVHIVVERKTVGDLHNSIADGRLQGFVEKTGGTAPPANLLRSLLIEGEDSGFGRIWSENGTDNLKAELQAAGIIVIHSDSAASTSERLVSFWRWTGKNGHRTLLAPVLPRLDPRVYLDADTRDAVRALMAALGPGWGEDRCRAVLQMFHTPADVLMLVMAQDIKALTQAPGIGKGLVQSARAFLQRRAIIV